MSDWEYSDHFSVIKQANKEKKLSNREFAVKRLSELGISFQYCNDGIHLIVSGNSGLIDFWPSTGKWKCRKTGDNGRGIRHVIKRSKNIMD